MPFVKGQSGNPAGRPLGSRNKANLALEEALSAEGGDLASRIIEHAKLANPAAMRLCMDRMMPKAKERPVDVMLPPADTPDYARTAIDVIVRELGEGEITISEANGLLGLVERIVRLLASKAVERLEELAAGKRIAKDNAETMTAAAALPPLAPAVVNNNGNTSARNNAPAAAGPHRTSSDAIERLMNSTSPLAHLADAMPGKKVPAMPPRVPAAEASAA